MNLEELTTPTVAKLPLREFAEHLKIGSGFSDDGSEDAVLEICLRAAMAAIEARIGKILLTRKLGWRLTRWFEERAQGLPVAPVSAIDDVTLYDAGGVSAPVDPALYRLEPDAVRPKLVAHGAFLPTIPRDGSVVIGFEAGFGVWAKVPADLRHAMLLLAASYYENRSGEGRVNGMPFGVMALLEGHREIRIGGGQ